MTEECSAAILNQLLEKDPGNPTISCSIGSQQFDQALCDLGASVSFIPKVVYDKLNHNSLSPTTMCLQLADQSVQYLAGIAEDIPIKIRSCFIPVDFVVLDISANTTTPLILGRPFFSTANAHIDVGAREIHLNINGKEEIFHFKLRPEQCVSVELKPPDISIMHE